jgi:hypothetical protein
MGELKNAGSQKTEVRSSLENFFYPMKVELSGQLLLFKSLLISRNKFQISTFFHLLTSVFWPFKTNSTKCVKEPIFINKTILPSAAFRDFRSGAGNHLLLSE